MKILLITNYPPDAQQSMLRYAEMLKRELQERGYDVSTAHPPVVLGSRLLKGPLKKWIGYIDKYLLAPAYLRSKAKLVDLVHVCDHSNSMYLKCAGVKPALITCHDLLAIFSARGKFKEIHTGLTGRILQRWISSNLVSAKYVVCASAKTADDLRELTPSRKSIVRVIHHLLNWSYSPASSDAINEEKRRSGLSPDENYLLHVGGNQWYKNRLGVMRIFAELRKHARFHNTKLIMAGKPWTPEMHEFREIHGLHNTILERVNVSNEALQALYSGAFALLFPSLEEGFGWPVLEAQACGCPVIASNRPPMTEIAGDAALLIDPVNAVHAAQIIAENVSQLSLLRERGFANLTRFAPDKIMHSYIEVYEQLIRENS